MFFGDQECVLMKKNKLMVAGPTEIEADVRKAGSSPMVYNRTPEFSQFILQVEKKLKLFFKTKNDVFILSSSGTGAMECAMVNFLSPGDEAVILSGGTFGYRWHEIASRYGIRSRLITVSAGESVDPEVIKAAITDATKAVFVTANETSTGVVIDLEAIGKHVKETQAILVVDAVSSLGADRLETDKWHCDVVITAGQKALAIPPGIAFVSVSEKAWRLADQSTTPKYYFDLRFYRDNLPRGQTPFTPPISLLYQLDARLKKIRATGLEVIIEQQRAKSLYLQDKLKSIGLKVIGSKPSNGVVGILFPDQIDAFHIVERLREEYKIEITPSPGRDKTRIARIGLFGDLTKEDIDYLIRALKELIMKNS
jgi:aspartate aminotransferase-like enzyme